MDYFASSELNKCLNIYEGSRAHKLARIPMRLLKSKLLKLFTRTLGVNLKLQAQTFWGESMTVVFPEGISTQIYQYGFLDKEEGLTQAIINYLKPGMVFFDIGAHFGYFSLLAACLVGKSGQVHAFEPVPSTFEILKINSQQRSNLHIHNLGVWSEDTNLQISDLGLKNSGFNSFYSPRMDARKMKRLKPGFIRVNTTSIDNYVERTGVVPNLIKIDAESSEYQILQGMEKTISKYHPILTLEIGDFNLEDVVISRDLLQLTRDKGYRAYDFQGFDLVEHQNKSDYESNNVFLLPEGAITIT